VLAGAVAVTLRGEVVTLRARARDLQ